MYNSADHLASNRLNSDHHTLILEQIQHQASHWRDIGAKLGFKPGELKNIQDNLALITNGPRSYLSELLTRWLELSSGDGRGSQGFATLERLKDALRQANLGATAYDLHI